MILLDLRSWFVLNGSLALLVSVVMLCLKVTYPRTIQGFGHWTVAGLLTFTSTLLFAGRSVIPDVCSIVVANMCLLTGVALYYVGMCRFYGVPRRWTFVVAGLLVTAVLLVYFTHWSPSYDLRVIVVSLSWSALMVAIIDVSWRHGTRRFPMYFTLAVCSLLVLVLWVRAFIAARWGLGVDLVVPSVGATFFTAIHTLVIVAYGFGLILQASERLREEYVQLASRDSLTNTLTRRVFYDAFAQEMARTARYKRSMALLLLDIDHFKRVNDTYGHQMGDRVLVSFAQRVASLLRRPDLLARLGGEEFAVLLPETSLEEAQTVAQRILAQVSEPSEAGTPSITVSIGIAMNQVDETTFDDLMARADRALYRAKERGRNRYECE